MIIHNMTQLNKELAQYKLEISSENRKRIRELVRVGLTCSDEVEVNFYHHF